MASHVESPIATVTRTEWPIAAPVPATRTGRQVAAAAAGVLVVVAVLWALFRPGPAAWVAAAAYSAGLAVLLGAAARRAGVTTLGPAAAVTLTRAALVGGVAALVADGLWTGAHWLGPVVWPAAAALALDAVDGPVARRTGTATPLGARLDMEVDAFLLLVLSAHVATDLGGWVVLIGAMRYAWLAAGRVLPWLRTPLPPRYSAKVVAAVQGIALVVAAAAVLPRPLAIVLVASALALLVWSFAHDARYLWRRGAVSRPAVRRAVTVLAGMVVVLALVAPREPVLAGFVRIPVEALVGAGGLLALPGRWRRVAAPAAGAVLAALAIMAGLDAGFDAVLARPFDPVLDWDTLGIAADLLAGSTGPAEALATVAAATALAAAVTVLLVLAMGRLAAAAARHRTGAVRAVVALGTVWTACALLGAQVVTGVPVASASATTALRDRTLDVVAGLRDPQVFAIEAGDDAYRDVAGDRLLTGLRGKDVGLVFVESYGRAALADPELAARIDPVLDEGNRRLAAAGVHARSGFLTSPTTGGESWLAHATLASGLWIDDDRRYRSLPATDRLTLGAAFRRAGWRTAGVMPGVTSGFPDAGFYGYDVVHDAAHLGYRGPSFSWATVPDQFTLAAFERLARSGEGPVMAEIPLVSSHAPWEPLPRLVGWDEVGDGSVYASMSGLGQRPDVILTRDPARVRADYAAAIEYSLATLVSYAETYADENLVLVVLGDHQPARVVTGRGAGADVPVTVIARDPDVLDRISGWGWHDGLQPRPDAPAWRMDQFRDRFLAAFGS